MKVTYSFIVDCLFSLSITAGFASITTAGFVSTTSVFCSTLLLTPVSGLAASAGLSVTGDARVLGEPSVGEAAVFFFNLSCFVKLGFRALGRGGLGSVFLDSFRSWVIPVIAMLTGRGCRGDGLCRRLTELVTLLVLCWLRELPGLEEATPECVYKLAKVRLVSMVVFVNTVRAIGVICCNCLGRRRQDINEPPPYLFIH